MISGASWEGFAVENILAAVPVGTQSSYYRTGAGAEIDLVLDFSSSIVSSKEIEAIGLLDLTLELRKLS